MAKKCPSRLHLSWRPAGRYPLAEHGPVYFLHGDRLGTPQVATDSGQNVGVDGQLLAFRRDERDSQA